VDRPCRSWLQKLLQIYYKITTNLLQIEANYYKNAATPPDVLYCTVDSGICSNFVVISTNSLQKADRPSRSWLQKLLQNYYKFTTNEQRQVGIQADQKLLQIYYKLRQITTKTQQPLLMCCIVQSILTFVVIL